MPDEDKAALRQVLFARRKAAFAQASVVSAPANAHLLTAIGNAKGLVISGYRPIRTELDPTAAMTTLHLDGARLCVPVIEGAGQPLTFREWTPGCAMTKGAFGADIPTEGAWLTPDILIAPLLGWDRKGWRLGYGGGFYDRTLEGLRASRTIRAIGFAFTAQEVAEIPREPTDQPLDAIVTEAEILECGA
jgi:5-formyltetrahydrofolate cyclo-ligase